MSKARSQDIRLMYKSQSLFYSREINKWHLKFKKKMLFNITLKKSKKYLGINLTNYVWKLHNSNERNKRISKERVGFCVHGVED